MTVAEKLVSMAESAHPVLIEEVVRRSALLTVGNIIIAFVAFLVARALLGMTRAAYRKMQEDCGDIEPVFGLGICFVLCGIVSLICFAVGIEYLAVAASPNVALLEMLAPGG